MSNSDEQTGGLILPKREQGNKSIFKVPAPRPSSLGKELIS